MKILLHRATTEESEKQLYINIRTTFNYISLSYFCLIHSQLELDAI